MRTWQEAAASERGETLLELLVAVVIMSIALVAIVGGLVVSIHVSDIHRKQATAGWLARNYAEFFENQVATGGYFPACDEVDGGEVSGQPGYTWSMNSSCRQGDGPDMRLLTISVSNSDERASESVALLVRRVG